MLNTSPQTAASASRARRKTKGTGSPRRIGLEGPVPAINSFALIIGSMKCGTTSLYDYLVTHPEIAQCQVKEPNFFGSQKWKEGADYYCRHWPEFDPARHAYALEASVDYTKLPRAGQTASRIAQFGRDFKFMFIARDPVDRVESHIAHNISKGRVTPENYAGMMKSAISVSRYAFQLDRFRETVGGQEVLVLDFEHLKRDPITLLDRCVRFLGIDEDFVFEPRPPSNQRRALNGAETFRLSPEERETVAAHLASDAQRFSERYDFDISAWNMPAPDPHSVKKNPALPAVAVDGKQEAADKR